MLLEVYAEVPVLFRIPLRLEEAAEFATGPELRFEPRGKRSALLSHMAKTPVNQEFSCLCQCGRAGRLVAGLGAYFQQLWSSWGTCDCLAGWCQGSHQPKSLALPGAFLWAPNLPSVLRALFSFGGQPRAAVYSLFSCVAGSSYNNFVNMNEHVSPTIPSEKSHIFLFLNEQFLPFNVSDLGTCYYCRVTVL